MREVPTKRRNFLYLIINPARRVGKIGRTSIDPRTRLAQLQTGSIDRLELFGYIDTRFDAEQKLHERLAKFRVTGEWFRHTPLLRTVFCMLEEEGADVQLFEGRGLTAEEVLEWTDIGITRYLHERIDRLWSDSEWVRGSADVDDFDIAA